MSKTLNEKLASIQANLHAPKNQRNSFGNYNYRSCEDILEAVKPLLGDVTLTINDDMTAVLDRVYAKATATLSDGEHSIVVSAFAREPETKKGMDLAQLTGATSSYARKYALNGLFLIDDNKDADTDESKGGKVPAPKKPTTAAKKDSFRRKAKSPVAEGDSSDDI